MAPRSAGRHPNARSHGRSPLVRTTSRSSTRMGIVRGPRWWSNRAVIRVHTFDSPVGPLTTAERAGRVCLLHFGPDEADVDRMFDRWYPGELRQREPLPVLGAVLDRYFAGETTAIDGIAVELNGTPFQKTVWTALRRIPCGTTISYAELAK